MSKELKSSSGERSTARPFSEMPGDTGKLPLAGDLFEIMRDPTRWMARKHGEHGTIFWVQMFGFKQVCTIGPDANQALMLDHNKVLSSKLGWGAFIGKLFPRGLMLRDFEEHMVHRRLMQTAFRKQAMVRYVDDLQPAVAREIERWSEGAWGERRNELSLGVYPSIKLLSLNLACQIFMGAELGEDTDRISSAFLDCVNAGGAWIKYPIPGLKFSKGLKGRQVLVDYFHRLLAEKRDSDDVDLFSQLCRATDEDGNRYSDQDIVDHMIFLLMAAHDTVTITMTTMIYELGRHPAWQDRLRKVHRAIGERFVAYDDLPGMIDVELVMKESMRLISPVPLLPRMTTEDTELQGYQIPKGTLVTVSMDYAHRMAEYWPDPLKFDPERFAEGRREDHAHKFAFTPFGGGAHKCIGIHFAYHEIKSVLHQMLLTYRWRVPPGYEMKFNYSSLPKPKDDVPIVLTRLDGAGDEPE